MTVNKLFDIWFSRLRQLDATWHLSLVRNLAWFVTGLYVSRSVQLHHIARHVPGAAQLVSQTRRLSRLLDNPHLRVRAAYAPVARAILQQQAKTHAAVVLIVDGTQVTGHHQLLLVAVRSRRRALPIAWTWVRLTRGTSSAHRQRALLAYVRTLLPSGCSVVLVGDSEFGSVGMLCQLDAWGWRYVLRQKGWAQVRTVEHPIAQSLRELCSRPGERRWRPGVWLTKRSGYRTNLLLDWQRGQRRPWYLATNCSDPHAALRAYRQRMAIEELFGDWKRHGVDLASTHLRHIARLSRLVFLVALLYLWLIDLGGRTQLSGHRPWVDRNDRRDLSFFQIGWRILQRYLANDDASPPLLLLLKVSGG